MRVYIFDWVWIKKIMIFLWMFLFFNEVQSTQQECLDAVKAILQNNSPELLVIPNQEELSIFTTSKVHISVTWSHIDALLGAVDKSCVGSYLLEYGPHAFNSQQRGLSPSEITPALTPDKTSHTITVDDDCNVYSVHMVVIPSLGSGADLIYSQRKAFWPAAYRTVLDVHSNSAVVSWPPSCSYVTSGWQLEACPGGQFDDSRQNCLQASLNGESPVHLTNLNPCRLYHFRLRGPTLQPSGLGPRPVLWIFPPTRTLPKPDVEAVSGHTSLRILIDQGSDCDDAAVVQHWRITHCTSSPEPQEMARSTSTDEEGSGDDEEYPAYVGEEPIRTCINQLHEAGRADRLHNNRQDFLISNLKQCTLYSIDISPADPSGQPLQPGEQYDSVHSTLCQEEDNGFWFSNEDNVSPDSLHIQDNIPSKRPVSNLKTTLVTGSCVLCVGLLIIGIRWSGVIGCNTAASKQPHTTLIHEEDVSPKMGLLTTTTTTTTIMPK